METPAACKTVDLPVTPSLLKKDDVVWVNMGSKAGTRGFDGEAFWATVLEIIPATDEVRVRRHDTKRNRKVPAGACKYDKAPDPNTTRVTDSAPDPNSRLSWKRLGSKEKKRLEGVAKAKVSNDVRRLVLECEKLREANGKALNAAASEKERALKRLQREHGPPPPPPRGRGAHRAPRAPHKVQKEDETATKSL